MTVWFARTPSGGWQKNVLIADAYCHNLELADLDGNGADDGICLDQHQPKVLHLVQGASPTDPWTSTLVDARNVMGLAVGDIDGDGPQDFVAGRAWYRNTGTGWVRYPFTTMQTVANYPAAPFSDYSSLTLVDLNGDLRLDIFATLFSESPEGKVVTFLAPTDATTQAWTAVEVDPGPLFAVHSQQVADFDGSGRPQFVVGESNYGGWDLGPNPDPQIYLYRLVGDPAVAGSWDRSTLDTIGTHEVKAADLDGDGLLDLAGHFENTDFPTPTQNGPVHWWENQTVALSGPAPESQSPPSVTGTTRIGSTLAGTNGTWGNAPGSYSYQWLRCQTDGTACLPIAGATRSTYAATLADQFSTLRFRVTARNSSGVTPATSAATGQVLPDPSGAPAYAFSRQTRDLREPGLLRQRL